MKVGAYDAWKWSGGALRGAGIRVAILDAGVSCAHPSLCGHFASLDGSTVRCGASQPPYCAPGNGFDFMDADKFPDGYDAASSSYLSHGTQVASLVVGTTPDVGTAPAAKILSIRIGASGIVGDQILAEAILRTAASGVDIINLSKVWWQHESPRTQAALAQIAGRQYGHGRGVLVVAATDDRSVRTRDVFAGAYASRGLSNVIAVTGTDRNDRFVYYQERPAEEHMVAAPSSQIVTADGTSGTRMNSGNSMAAPIVAGIAADLWSYRPFSKLTAGQLRCAIIEGAKEDKHFARYVADGAPSTVPIASLAFVTDDQKRAAVLERCSRK
jgi:subtilisin family serine protease